MSGLNKEEKKFWKSYKDQVLQVIPGLLKRKNKVVSAKLILIAIENFGSFRLGRGVGGSKNKVLPPGGNRSTKKQISRGFEKLSSSESESFNVFVKQYIKDFDRNTFIERNKIWENYRCGLLHDGGVRHGYGINFSNKETINYLENNKKFSLNIDKLFDLIIKKSMPKFEKEIEEKGFVYNRWRERYKYLKNEIFNN
jgi:hypothetical protein